jgi:hypothetical protein
VNSDVETTRLSRSEFQALLEGGVTNISGQEDLYSPQGVIDIAPYVKAIAPQDLDGYSLTDKLLVDVVYRTARDSLDLVHVMTTRKNVYLVLVVDNANYKVSGHYLLDLNQEYGLGAANDT